MKFTCPRCTGIGEIMKVSGQWIVCPSCKGKGEFGIADEPDQPMSPEDAEDDQ